MLRDPRVRFHALHLLAHIFSQIVEAIEIRRLTGIGAHFSSKVCSQLVFFYLQQAAVGVIDDDEFLSVEKMMRNDQRAQSVVRGNAAGIADHVRIARLQSEAALEKNAGIHAGEHSYAAARLDRKVPKVEVLYEFLIGFEQFVCD